MKIKVFADYRDICGGKFVELPVEEQQPVVEVLDQLIERHPPMYDELFTQNKELKPLIHVFINGKNIVHADGLQTVVHPEDEIALFPPVAGG